MILKCNEDSSCCAVLFVWSSRLQVLSCPVSGQLQPLTTPAATCGSSSYSLTSLLLPPPPPTKAVDASMDEEKENILTAVQTTDTSVSASPALLKKKVGSLLTMSTVHKPAVANSHPIVSNSDAPIIANDCLEAKSGICYHPAHTLAYLLDAAHLSVQICVDDGSGGRWPLQLNATAFRRIVTLADCSDIGVDDASGGDGSLSHPLRDSWLEMLRTGDVPLLSASPLTDAEEVVSAVLSQMRRYVFQHITQMLEMDEPHQGKHVADFMSVNTREQHS